MDKTLYILEKRGLEVLRDGPSIWIMENGKAGRRIPARLVSHVVIIGNVKMDAGTITLFTDNNVPVTFMSKNRGEIAVTIPHNHHLNSHSEEQKHLLARDGNIQRYNQWLQAERRRMQLKVVKKLSRQVSSIFILKICDHNKETCSPWHKEFVLTNANFALIFFIYLLPKKNQQEI